MIFKQAKAKAVKKWKHNLDNWKTIYKMAKESGFVWENWKVKYYKLLFKNLPKLKNLYAGCGFCTYYDNDCPKCIIALDCSCEYPLHSWYKWHNKPTKRNTLAMYNLVKGAKEK
jgi:hypothetical protein